MSTPIGREILRQRTQNVRNHMKRRELQALVAYSNPSWHGEGSTTVGNVRFLTNLTDPWRGLVLVLPAESEPALICATSDTVLVAKRRMQDVRVERPSLQGRLARRILEERSVPAGRVGVVGRDEMPAPIYLGLTAEPCRWRFEDADDVISQQRVIKGPEEIERHRVAARLCDHMYEALVMSARRPDSRTWELIADMDHAARAGGAEYARTWLATGPNAEGPTYFPSDNERRLEAGDQVFAGTHVNFDGYWGHAIRPGFRGTPTQAFKRVFEILIEVQDAGIAKLRPGVPLRDVDREMTSVIDRYFPGRQWGRSGHGLGLDCSDPLVSDYFAYSDYSAQDFAGNLILRPNMVLELHPGFRASELGCDSPKIGDTFLVTETQPERLTRFPREILQL